MRRAILSVASVVAFAFAFAIPATASAQNFDAPNSSPTHVHQRHTRLSEAQSSGTLREFSSESAAQAHCPQDVVVWLNTHGGIWHEKGMRWYGKTREGAYVCREEAAAAGDRDTRNGQ